MKRITKFIACFTFMIIILFIGQYSHAESGNRLFCDSVYSLHYDKTIDKIILGGEINNHRYIFFIDPYTANLSGQLSISIEGDLEKFITIKKEERIYYLVLLADTDRNPLTHDGKLQLYDSATGQPISGCQYIFNEVPLDCVVGSDFSHAYVTNGIKNEDKAYLSKINLDSFSLDAEVECGELPVRIEISPDSSKLYVENKTMQIRDEEDPIGEPENCSVIEVYNTPDLSSPSINRKFYIANILYKYFRIHTSINKIYISNPICRNETGTNKAIIMIDLNTNEISHINLDAIMSDTGTWDIEISPDGAFAFCNLTLKNRYNERTQSYSHDLSNLAVKIDLSDNSYDIPAIELGFTPINIAVTNSLSPGFNYRIFGIDDKTATLYFIDVQ